MNQIDNIWKNDKGFIWMLAITVVTLISTQLDKDLVSENKLIIRVSFFLCTLVAIKSSSLSTPGKSIGYVISTALLLLAIAMIRVESQLLISLYVVFSSGYMIFIITLIFNQIFFTGSITINKIGGGIATYILIGHLWTSMYLTVYILHPESFQLGGELIQTDEALKHLSYLSFVTLTTIGYGDIIVVGAVARILAMLEGLIGQLFPAIFIAKLVALQIEHTRK